jgi:pimeloyl-ACP methyl ester carboxylesterase
MPTLNLSPRLTLHYLDINPEAKNTVLLLHGLGADGTSWRLQSGVLASAGFRVLAPDMRGFGRSTYPGSSDLAAMAADVAALVAALNCGPVAVAGISMGGTVALHLALDHSALIQRLVLVNTCDRLRPTHFLGWLDYGLRYLCLSLMGMQAQASLVARHTFPHPHQDELRQLLIEQVVQSNWYGYMAALRALGCFNIRPRVGDIRVPTLVVTGMQDTTIPPEDQAALVTGIAGAQHVTIAEGGHGVTIDSYLQFNRILLDYLVQGEATSHPASTLTLARGA